MRHSPRLHLFLASCLLASLPLAASAQVVISQAYGGGGNSGATFTHDFVELFNRGAAPEALGGKSIQYASSSGNFNGVFTLPAFSLQPGQYYLVQLASGSGNGVALPATPDATGGSPNLAGASGKVALVQGTTALGCGGTTLACDAGQTAQIIDLLGYGSVNLSEGGANGPGLNNSSAARRLGAGCTDTDNNAADFESVSPPTPRNTATALNACGGGTDPTDPVAFGDASPAVLAAGDSTLLTVAVTPGTNPASTGLAVSADLSAIGGSATQAFVDDGTQGDLVADDGIFSFQATVSAGTPGGMVSLPVDVTDAEARSAATTIDLSIVAQVSIAQIQGEGIGSPLAIGTEVVTEGIVTARRSNGYFIQSAIGEQDGDEATAEGLFVFTNSPPPADAAVGNRVRVNGRVTSFSRTPHGYPLTQLGNASLIVQATDQPLPPAVELDASVLSADVATSALGRYQGMRVTLPLARVVGPTNGFGDFHVTLPDTDRPFREPGISVLDAVPLPEGNAIPRFDRNPERLRVESTGLEGGSQYFVDAGTLVTGMEGILYYDRGDFTLLLGDNAGLQASGGAYVQAVPLADAGSIRIGSFNIENLSGGASVPLNRLSKLSEVFCQYLRNPDVVGLVEISNLATLERLAQAINEDEFGFCPNNPQYQAILLSNTGSQRLGYLVSNRPVAGGSPRVEVLEVAEEFAGEPLVAPDNSTNSGALFDRLPLRLEARINADNGQAYPLTVIVNHTLSLLDVNSLSTRSDAWQTAGNRSRGKRLQQAVKLSELVESIQQTDPDAPLVLIGDFNAFEFSDGYVDMLGIITGQPAPSDEVLLYSGSAVTRPLLNLTTTLPQDQRHSYVFEGNTQSLDHALVNQVVLDETDTALFVARVNSDFAADNAADAGVPLRTSDHDPLVAELVVPQFLDADLAVSIQTTHKPVKGGSPVRFNTIVANVGDDRALDSEVVIRVNAMPSQVLGVQADGWLCSDPVLDNPGVLQSSVFCGRIDPLASGDSASLAVDVLAIRYMAETRLEFSAEASTRSNDVNAGNDQADATVKIAGRPERTYGTTRAP